ncbi:hypothetical protein FRX31_025965 [Thalictrum thalictroides]|uniref:Uncharacterized protein n=1 Tax=Thalictrum thalictroides TaxID=46969 RepID=A0A7J6VH90_THATH|nr:hypothetical protein FRX31_025965 [Thalictrum thalictroides]
MQIEVHIRGEQKMQLRTRYIYQSSSGSIYPVENRKCRSKCTPNKLAQTLEIFVIQDHMSVAPPSNIRSSW